MSETRSASEIACDLIRESEGFESRPYLCPAGVWSNGYGFTRNARGEPVTKNSPPITREEADAYLQGIVRCEMATVQRLVPGLDGPRLAALTDFVYNMGTSAFRQSTLLKRVLAGDWPGACAQLRRWVHAGDPPRVLQGLVTRREREIALIEGTL